jgi:hypothetical protein
LSVLGAIPKLHMSIAPVQTPSPIEEKLVGSSRR